MPYTLDTLLGECTDRSLPLKRLGEMHGRDVYRDIWNSMIGHMEIVHANNMDGSQLAKGVNIPNFAKITTLKTNNRPIFVAMDKYLRANGINTKKLAPALQTPCIDLNYSKIAYECQLDKDLVKSVVDAVFYRLGAVISENEQPVRIQFGKVGVLLAESRTMLFRFVGEKRRKGERGTTSNSFSKHAPASALGLKLTGSRTGTGKSANQDREKSPPVLPPLRSSQSTPQFDDTSNSTLQSTMNSTSNAAVNEYQMSVDSDSGKPIIPVLRSLTQTRGKALPTVITPKSLKVAYKEAILEKQIQKERSRLKEAIQSKEAADTLHAQMMKAKSDGESRAENAKMMARDQKKQHEQKVKREESEQLSNQSLEYFPFNGDEMILKQQASLKKSFEESLERQKEEGAKSMAASNGLNRSRSQPPPSPTMSNSLYPKFLTPCFESPARTLNPKLREASMNEAYSRLENEMDKQARTIDLEQRKTIEAKEKSDTEYRRKLREKREQQQELNSYLREQAKSKHDKDNARARERFYGKDPDPSLAFPVERTREMTQETLLRTSLKSALDQQIQEKKNSEYDGKDMNNKEDQFFLSCVRQQLRNDREMRKTKKMRDRELLLEEWDKQKALNDENRRLQRLRESQAVFSEFKPNER
jgi:hypothetical protein